jgi:hypothetical protein
MQKLIGLLIISLFLFSCQSDSQDSNEGVDELTKKRNEFAEISKHSSGAIEANWESSDVFVLTFKQGTLKDRVKGGLDKDGNRIYEHQAVGIARFNATLGSEATKAKTCIKILYDNGQELAFECAEST